MLPASTISGKVSLPDGTPVEGAEVHAQESRGGKYRGCVATATTDADGNYKLGRLLPTFYTLRIDANTKMKDTWGSKLGECKLTKEGSRESVNFVLGRRGVISGQVTLSDNGKGVPDYSIGISLSLIHI